MTDRTACPPLLADHAYGLLDPVAAAAVEAHIAGCPACATALAAARAEQGLFARAAKDAFPHVRFRPPAAGPVAEPSRRDERPAPVKTAAAVWLKWGVAAALLLTVSAVGGPVTIDTVGYAVKKPEVDREQAKVEELTAVRERLRQAVADRKATADRALKEAQDNLAQLETTFIAAEKAAVDEAARQPFHVLVSGPGTATPGAPNEYRVRVVDAADKPVPTAVTAALVTADGTELFAKAVEFKDAEVAIAVPAGAWAKATETADVTLNVTAAGTGGANARVTEKVRLFDPVYTTFLATDKPMYRPGEAVYYRSLTLDRTHFLPPARDTAVRFEVVDPSGQSLPGSEAFGLAKPAAVVGGRLKPTAGPDGNPVRGVGVGAFALPDTLAGGEYALKVWPVPQADEPQQQAAAPLAVRKFTVLRYTPDKFLKTLEFDGKSYGPGDAVQFKLDVKDQGKPLADATLRVTAQADGQPVKLDVNAARTAADGTASVRFTLPKVDELTSASVSVAVSTAATTETIVRPVPLASRRLTVEFFPEGGDHLIAGVPNRVYFRATTALGKPADVTGTLTLDGKEVEGVGSVRTLTDADHPGANQGMGVFTFTPEADKAYRLKLSKPVGLLQPPDGYPLKANGVDAPLRGEKTGLVLSAPAGVTKAEEPLVVKLWSPDKKRTVLVGAYTRGRPVAHITVAVEPGKATEAKLDVAASKLGGVTRITAFDLPTDDAIGRDDLKPLAERLVYRVPGETLNLKYTARKSAGGAAGAFVPGAAVDLDITATDEAGKPKAAVLWAAVVNQSVLTMADEKTDRLLPTHFLLSGEVQAGDQLEHSDFLLTAHPKAAEALDLLLGTQGWRRFAEQAPTEFRQRVPADEARRLMVASVDNGPIPTGWQPAVRRVFDEFWPRYEGGLLRLERSEADRAAAYRSGDAEADLRRASDDREAHLNEFGRHATELNRFDKGWQARRDAAPIYVFVLGTLVVGAVLVHLLAFKPGAAERRPFAALAVGLLLLLALYGGTALYTGLDNARWRELTMQSMTYRDTPRDRYGYEYATKATAPSMPAPAADATIDDLVVAAGLPIGEPDANRAVPKDAKADRGGDDKFAKGAAMPPAGPGGAFDPRAAEGLGGVPFDGAGAMPRGGAGAGLRGGFGGIQGGINGQNGGIGGGGLGGAMPAPGMAPKAKPQAMGLARPGAFVEGAAEPKARADFGRRPLGGEVFDGRDQLGGLRGHALNQNGEARFEQFRFREMNELRKELAARDGKEKQAERLLQDGLSMVAPPVGRPMIVREYAHARPQPPTDTEARTDFTETLLWKPVLVTAADGKASVSFALSDAVAPYRVLVAGHTLDGRIGAVTGVIEVRKPFSLDPKLPQEISSTDKLDVPVVGLNGTDEKGTAEVTVRPTGLKLAGPDKLTFGLAPTSGGRTLVRLTPEKVEGELRVQLDGKAGGAADSVVRTLTVVPDGFPADGAASDVLESKATAKLPLPKGILPGTLKVRATVYPNTLSEIQAGLDALLREPNGCFEQASTSNYPNVLVLDYLTETNQAKPDVSKRAKDLLDRGYSRLIGYECLPPGGGEAKRGYEWFGGTAPPHEALTAYGLLEFTDMARVFPVDAAMLKRTKQYLLDSRTGTGGFKRNAQAVDSFGRAPPAITDAYILWAITEAERRGGDQTDLAKELDAAFAKAKDGDTAKDPYYLSLVANALLNRGRTADGEGLLKVLAKMQAKDGSVPGAATSITNSTGQALLIETTAMATLGWLKANEAGGFRGNVDSACRWIGGNRSAYGGYGSTQSTILGLKALIEYARSNKRPAESGTAHVFVGNKEVASKAFTTSTAGPIVLDIPAPEEMFKEGAAEVRVETDAKQPYPLTVSWECRTVQPNSSPECPIGLTTKLGAATAAEGDTVRLNVAVANTKDTAQNGMVTCIVGLPAGLKLPEDMKQVKALTAKPVDAKARPTVDYWEVRGRELVLYWRGMAAKQNVAFDLDLIADVPGEYRGPASRAYLYYGAEHKTWVPPVGITITGK